MQPQNFSYSTQKILDIFIKNNLIPIFKNHEITNLYKKFFSDGENLKNQLAEVEKQIEIEEKTPKLSGKIDLKILLKNYDVEEIKKSPIKYFKSVLSLSDKLLGILDEYEQAQSETIGEYSRIALKLDAKFINSPNLTEKENLLLEERQKFLAEKLELGTDEVKRQIISVKMQAEEMRETLKKINRGENSIVELAEFEKRPRASFEFLAENLAEIIDEAQEKLNFFAANKNFVTEIINLWESWNENYKSFKTNLILELKNICDAENIEAEIYKNWCEDWQKKRFAIEEKFLPLTEFSLRGNLQDSAIETLKILQNYKSEVDKFYMHERKNIYQKFAFQEGGDLQEKFETESELYKIAEKLQRDLQKIIFSSKRTEERIFLLKWAEKLINIPIDEITEFVHDRQLDKISEEVLTQFAELRRKNFATYLADSQAYGRAIQQREKEYNSLIFKMRKDLQKK